MKKNILSVLLAAALAGSMAGCAMKEKPSSDLQKITFVLDWVPNTNHTGIYVAKEKGYFEDEGLDVEIVQPPEDGAEMLVGAKKAQFGISSQDGLMPALIGDNAIPVEAVAAVVQHNTSGIISRKGEGMDRPKGLEGKKYATWDKDLEKAMIKNVMEEDGGEFSKVELIPSTVTDEVSALESKSVDAIWIFYGWTGIASELADFGTDYFAFKDIKSTFDFYTPVIIGNTNWMNENPDTTKAFLNATKKGYEFTINHPEEAVDILSKAAPELDKELIAASQAYLNEQYKAEVEQWGYIDPDRWNRFYNWISENDLSEIRIPENTGFTNAYLE
ncbi:ABC transporter substrate-binding protein [Clostridium sp. C105KSO13]|uniref:ABC transporter substrate-binding protein n=1 Tax=Clostridium sp. C105KSO13 TaxID=1776045 RepID=UPI0007405DE5|nr:ABC transporter substrate-binding protein [Clostridium sp. C105KSO13]CUX30802.1 Putative thiamine biosynthesis protein [Clostridium sp. C105KSO13]